MHKYFCAMKQIFTALMLLLSFIANAEKNEVILTNDKIVVDDSLYAFIERDGCGFGSNHCEYTVFDKEHQKVLVITPGSRVITSLRSQSNPTGTQTYLKFSFLSLGENVEVTKWFAVKTEKIARFIVKNELFKGGYLDIKAAKAFAPTNE